MNLAAQEAKTHLATPKINNPKAAVVPQEAALKNLTAQQKNNQRALLLKKIKVILKAPKKEKNPKARLHLITLKINNPMAAVLQEKATLKLLNIQKANQLKRKRMNPKANPHLAAPTKNKIIP